MSTTATGIVTRRQGRLLVGDELADAMRWLNRAAAEARRSRCARRRCGAVLACGDGLVLGTGFNGPPGDSRGRCHRKHEIKPGFKSDTTCCMHAEQRAILDAFGGSWGSGGIGDLGPYLRVDDARMYFAGLQDMAEANEPSLANEIAPSGDPYCTICSKMALDVGVSKWVLLHPEGVRVYGAEEYNDLSFAYGHERRP